MPKQRFVLVPGENRFNRGQMLPSMALMAGAALRRGSRPHGAGGHADGRTLPAFVVDAIETEHGVDGWLVELNEAQRLDLRTQYPDLQLVQERTASMAFARPQLRPLPLPTMAGARRGTATVVVKARSCDGKPVARAWVTLAYEGPEGYGATAETDADGEARLCVARSGRARYLRVEPAHSHWHAALVALRWSGDKTFRVVCPSIDPAAPDVLAMLGGHGGDEDGAGVVVAVIDGGAGPHSALPRISGANLASAGRASDDIADNGIGHGTHVAGIIAGRRDRGGVQGVAPGVTLKIYRVYEKNSTTTGSFSVAAAIRRAVDDGADLINLSLTLPDADPVLLRQLERARAKGCVIIAAAGNEGAGVAVPANQDLALAVSAAGCLGSWPDGAAHALDLSTRPRGHDKDHFMAAFSNHGPEIDLVGAGVAVVSLYPKNRLAIMNGTSMAAPAVTGALARALARDDGLMSRPRDQARSDAIVALALRSAHSLGFPAAFEGRGLLGAAQ